MRIGKLLKETVTYWSKPTIGGFGNLAAVTPSTPKGRWEDKQVLFRDSSGKEVLSEAVIYLNCDIEIGGYLYQGISVSTSPTSVGAREIRGFEKVSSTRGNKYLRTAYV